jgi:hypothetical protein
MSHDRCGNRVADADGVELVCMQTTGHWTRGAIPHYDLADNRSWVFLHGSPMIWDGDGSWPGILSTQQGRAISTGF